jgi:hypothetical protein
MGGRRRRRTPLEAVWSGYVDDPYHMYSDDAGVAVSVNMYMWGWRPRSVPLQPLWSECVYDPYESYTDDARLAVSAHFFARVEKRLKWIAQTKRTAEYGAVAGHGGGTSTPPVEDVWYLCKRPFELKMRVWREKLRQVYQDHRAHENHNMQGGVVFICICR